MDSPERARTFFVALPATADLEGRLVGAPRGVSTLVPADWHVTIAFLGTVSEAAARAGFDALRIDLPPCAVTLGAIEPMGAADRWSALAAQVTDARVVRAIDAARGAVWRAAGARADDRPVRPHLTLARVGRRAGHGEREAALAWARRIELTDAAARLERAALYASARSREHGARYEILAARPL
jgi:2'-5' RNA ligase